jgi:hypothetical protein
MAFELLLSTSGTPATIYVHGRELVHPVVDLNLLDEVTLDDLFTDEKFIDGLATGDFTLKFKNNEAVTDISEAFFPGTFGRLNNPVATVPPAATDDNTKGYGVGSWWIDLSTSSIFFCTDATTNLAVWTPALGGTGSGVLTENDVQNANATPGATTTSKSYIDLVGNGSGGEVALTTVGTKTKPYVIMFSGSFAIAPSNRSVLIQLLIDGNVVAESERELKASSANAPNTLSTNHYEHIAPGKIIKIQWKVDGGGSPTGTCDHATLSIKGVG